MDMIPTNHKKEHGKMRGILKLLIFYLIASHVNVCHLEISFIDNGQNLENPNRRVCSTFGQLHHITPKMPGAGL
jgi:hypothetical protein